MTSTLQEIDQLFEQLTTFQPRHFQQETILRLLKLEDVLLRAPTGAGKTETAVVPFLFAKVMGIQSFPNKLIYIVPLRTLATSLRNRVEKYVRDWEKIYPPKRPLVVTLQTGENPEDPRFEGDIIFCTIDQLLSSFLSIPYSVGRGSANVNAGVVFASYLVFDELHLLDPDRAFVTTLELLRQVQGISPFLLMTATLTKELAAQICQEIKGLNPLQNQTSDKVIQLVNVEGEDLKVIETRRRYFEPASEPLTAQGIWADVQQHQPQRKRVIALCNTVAQAQGLFQDLRNLVAGQLVKVVLLHSRFLATDRKVKEDALKKTFGKEDPNKDDGYCYVLISTQVIEAGIDITCDVMHTMLCPMNALLQRAGRCARFSGQVGTVKVYREMMVGKELERLVQSEDDDDEIAEVEKRTRRKFLPYQDSICELTWVVLQKHSQLLTTEPVGYEIEAYWINQVHEESDRQQAQTRQKNRKNFDDHFREAIFQGEQAAKDLIRYVDNRSIFMVVEESMIDGEMPKVDLRQLEAFSLPKTTLLKVFREFQESYARDWLFKEVVQPEKKKSEGYSLPVAKPITHQREIIASVRLLVNPRYADYDDEVGLQIGVNVYGNYLSQVKPVKSVSQEYCYHMDTYVVHLGRMWTCWHKDFPPTQPIYQSMGGEQLQAGGRFICRKFFPHATREQVEAFFELLVFLAVIIHDLGKLQVQWQSVMRGWQIIAHKYFNGTDPKDQLIAHTDYNPNDDISKDNEGRIQKDSLEEYEKQNSRPPHAIESAFLAYEILEPVLAQVLEQTFQVVDGQVIENFCQVVEMAAGRHHSAWAKGWQSDTLAEMRQDRKRRGKLQLHSKANDAIKQSWQRLIGKELPKILLLPSEPPVLSQLTYDVEEIELNCFSFDQMHYQQLYWLVVRGLRICDGRSVQIGGVKR